jgi:hypothetical protein
MIRRVALIVGLAGMAAVGLAPEAHAGPVVCLAEEGHGDGRVRPADETYVGAGIYACNTDDGQTALGVRSPGQKFKFDVRFKNDSNKTRAVRVAALETDEVVGQNPDFQVKFTVNGKNVTDAVMFTSPVDKVGKRFKNIPAGASNPTIKGTIKVEDGADAQTYELRLPGFVFFKSAGMMGSSAKADAPYAIVSVPI